MRILVLGGNGFLGRHLVEVAQELGHETKAYDMGPGLGFDQAERLDVLDIAPEHLKGFDRIFHLAGVLGTAETFDDVERAVRTNILGTHRVLRAALEHGIPTTYVTLGNDWLNPYTITKNAASNLCRMFHEYHGLPVQVVVTYNVYGPYQKWKPVRKIVPCFLWSLLKGQPVEVNGDGEQVVDLVYARDFAREVLSSASPGTVHVGTGVPRTVNDTVRLCAEALGIETYRIVHKEPRRGEPVHSVSLSSVGFQHIEATPLEEGLRVTADWYRRAIARHEPEPAGPVDHPG